jgi:hypothetical protein
MMMIMMMLTIRCADYKHRIIFGCVLTMIIHPISCAVYKLGFKNFTPPYMDPSTHGRAILRGVNYASGGGGILNETGRAFVKTFRSNLGFRV